MSEAEILYRQYLDDFEKYQKSKCICIHKIVNKKTGLIQRFYKIGCPIHNKSGWFE